MLGNGLAHSPAVSNADANSKPLTGVVLQLTQFPGLCCVTDNRAQWLLLGNVCGRGLSTQQSVSFLNVYHESSSLFSWFHAVTLDMWRAP